ncbi:site-specific integrase [Gemmata sp. JC673]|uniref:Site-specific integrase n=1 Tax=Gemmata algarum TaxID=2975278 RepID=A0ABU5EUI0_9BACT|nr:site-specific integrase [Gemmata algarum]MDY3558107.1 site-specific integrase [Gemmata algarum]
MFRVTNLIDSFTDALKVRVKLGQAEQSTLVWYTGQLKKLRTAAGDFPAADLRAHHLVAVEFTYHFVRALKALYKWAADEDAALVPRDPFRKLKPPPCGERQRILSRAEMRELYLASEASHQRFLFVLSRTIARPGEIRGLKWGDIQWDRRLITLRKFKGKKRRTDGVKVRTIPLDKAALRMLRNLHRRAGSPTPDAPVWKDRFGKQLTSNGLRCRMRRARLKAGLDPEGVEERVVCYTMRHTGATNATRKGVTDTTLAKVMGHSRSSTTNRYQHLAGDDLVNAIDRASARSRSGLSRSASSS